MWMKCQLVLFFCSEELGKKKKKKRKFAFFGIAQDIRVLSFPFKNNNNNNNLKKENKKKQNICYWFHYSVRTSLENTTSGSADQL